MNIDVRKAITQSDSPDNLRITLNIWEQDTPELRAILAHHFPQWANLFAMKNSEYGSGSAFELGERGQFSDIYRKIIKLKRAMWDASEDVLTTESVDEILMDLIGHCFLTLEMRRRRMGVELDLPTEATNNFLGEPMSREEFERLVEASGLFIIRTDEPNGESTEKQFDGMPEDAEVYDDGQEKVDPMLVTSKDKARLLDVMNSDKALWPKFRRGDGVVFEIGDRVHLKQHLGKGKMLEVLMIGERGGHDIMVGGDSKNLPAWVHPAWLVKEGQKSKEELALEASIAARNMPKLLGDI